MTNRPKTLDEIEREALAAAIAACGSIVGAARQLGIGRATAFRKARKYGLDSPYDRTTPITPPIPKTKKEKEVAAAAAPAPAPFDPLFSNWKP